MRSTFAIERAFASYNEGDISAAARWAELAILAQPDDPQVLLIYGMVMNAGGDFQKASSAFRKLTRLQPKEPAHWMNFATSQRAMGDLDSAATGYDKAAKLGGWNSVLHYNVALLELERGNFSPARTHLAEAAAAKPVDAEIGCRYAQCLMQSGEPSAFRQSLQDWQLWQGWTPDLLAEAAMLLLTAGDQAAALGIVERLKLNPSNTDSSELTLISILERTNCLSEATARFESLNRERIESTKELRSRWLHLRAQLASRNGRDDEAIETYREILQADVPLISRHEILFPLAKALDSQHQSLAAFEAVTEAHTSQMAYFDLTAPLAGNDTLGAEPVTMPCCDPEDAARWDSSDAPSTQDSPVFIVAFPRSGTTLLEQTLDAHPSLKSMDEQRFLLDAQECLQEDGLIYPSKLSEASPEQLARARERYWEQVSTKVNIKPGQRLLDKNPLNMLRLPTIKRLWPNSPVLLVVRHPFDVITSNFFQHYRSPDFARLCRDLPSLTAGYVSMFDQWYRNAEVLQPKVLEVIYEGFISDLEGSARRIADFCGLNWHDAMLEPGKHAKSKGYIGTPSYHQVVLPVSAKAVGRWRAYESELLPLASQVNHLATRWGYVIR